MSGSTIGGVVGGVIGFVVSGFNPVGFQVGFMVGSAVGGYLDPTEIKGPRLNDAQAQTATEGAPRPIVFGTAVVAGNIIQCGPLDEHENTERVGKGGSTEQTTYTYTRTFAVRVCEGPVGGISRIWADDKLIYDTRDPADWPDAAADISAMAADTSRTASQIAIYFGDETQLPDSTLEALPAANGGGSGNVPAYRGSCYVVFRNWDLTARQGSVPQLRFEVSACGTVVPSIGDQMLVTGSGTAPSSQPFAAYATQPTDWTTIPYSAMSVPGGLAAYDGANWIIATGTASRYSTDLTAWNSGTTSASYPSASMIASDHAGRVVMAGTYISASAVFTTDGGATWNPCTLPQNSDFDALAYGGGRWMGWGLFSGTSKVQVVSDDGETFVVGVNLGTFFTTTNALCYGGSVWAGGFYLTTAALDDPCSLKTSSDGGDTWEEKQTPDTVIMEMGYARGTWVAITHGGDVLVSTNNWVGMTTYIGALPAIDASIGTPPELIFNGTYWVVSYSQLSSGNGIYYALPSNLATWNGPINAGVGGPQYLATRYTESDTLYSVPDAPTYYVDTDGNISGPGNDSVSNCQPELSEIVTDLCARVGVTSSQLDVSQLTDSVRGFVVGQPMSAADAIRSLQQGYFFDFPEWGDYTDTATKLRGIKRGGSYNFTITDDDLVDSDEDQDTRPQAVEFPRKLNLITSDVDADYNPTKQTAERRTENVKAVGEANVQLPLSLTRAEAAPKADIMLKVAWMEAEGRTQFTLPEEFSAMVPSDPFIKDSKRWRAEEIEYGDGTVAVKAVRDRVSAYSSDATSGDAIVPSAPTSGIRGPTLLVAMNLPSLRSADNVPGIYVGVQGLVAGWPGCAVMLSVDGGVSEQLVATITQPAVMGELTADCASSGEPIAVKAYYGGSIDSVTADQIAARMNAFAIITGGVAEIGRVQTVTEGAEREYDWTDVTRGDLETTAAAHSTGDKFVMLDRTVFIPIDASHSGETLILRAVTNGTVPASNATVSVVFDPPTFVIDGGEIT